MIDININNYEIYFIDYFDGNLSPSEEIDLLSFLKQNPQLQEEFETFQNVELELDNSYYKNKDRLKRTSLLEGSKATNFDELCIANIEGDLSHRESALFEQMVITDMQKKREYDLFAKTILQPDISIIYNKKDKLKKRVTSRWKTSYSIVSIAASIILLFGLYTLLPESNQTEIFKETIKITENISGEPEAKQTFEQGGIRSDEKDEDEKHIKTDRKGALVKEEININEETILINENIIERETIAYLKPINIGLDEIEIDRKPLLDLDTDYEIEIIENKNNSVSLKSFLAQSINNRLFKKKKEKIEMFDIAQAGVEQINKWTGSKMTLERIYDKNGNLDKTAFNSRLIAFSTPTKK